ncbi:tyrosine-type recombinase/integrase [Hydrogenophaga sp. PBL-H3]|uniref:tyrosine-type recombinase/integrase n=1 Tax=Hydrogenophaga sp. PBL-H3 TaxID=434010 RepID=UPI00131F5EC7|nr:integrase family protein [Hydrogenophaga sp. PBL-H3]QHE76144.1 integrase family protein [Hydrogenophaga sp. PBL-H3]QHE80568.1 integrase family protein [Hydrogenophaga sp. PBL-H3]
MARPKKTDAPDTSQAIELTAGAIERLNCRADSKAQSFLRDTKVPGLRVRVTNTGAKSFVFESKLNRQTIRRTIGDVRIWSIDQARTEARALAVMLDRGQDPREIDRLQHESRRASKAQEVAREVTVGEAWTAYVAERRPHWGELHLRDHLIKASPGGEPSKRRGQTDRKTQPGPLAALMPMRLSSLDSTAIESWAAAEGKTRPSSARLAWRLLSVFLRWCAEQQQYAGIVPTQNPAKSRKAREALGKAGVKSDVLTREQLSAWFGQVRQIQNPCIAAYLQMLLLTGARPGEVLALQWADVNTQWKGISIKDKVEGTREIPLTPYVAHLLSTLPRRNEWVFSSVYALDMSPTNVRRRAEKAVHMGVDAPVGDVKMRGAGGKLSEPNTPHTRACKAAGVEGLTLHGLRRSFASLTEWLEIPAGVVAQIQGHKPSATAEKHYKRRPLDLLRVHHERIETWILEQACVKFDTQAERKNLQAVPSPDPILQLV